MSPIALLEVRDALLSCLVILTPVTQQWPLGCCRLHLLDIHVYVFSGGVVR
jgi:hypothetical protein